MKEEEERKKKKSYLLSRAESLTEPNKREKLVLVVEFQGLGSPEKDHFDSSLGACVIYFKDNL